MLLHDDFEVETIHWILFVLFQAFVDHIYIYIYGQMILFVRDSILQINVACLFFLQIP